MYKYSKGINLIAGGEKHRVYVKKSPTGVGKGVKGHVMVNHPTEDKGKWDTIDLTEKASAKTVEDGKNATKKWHRENPMKMQEGNKSTEVISNTDTLKENYSGMQKFYTDLFAAGNKYKNKETGVVGPFNAARALLKASIKNPSVLFSKRHRLKDPQSNPYNVQGYTTKDIFGNTKSWLPTDWNENIVNTEPTKKTAFARYPGNKQNKTGKLIQNRMVNSKRVDNISVTGPSYVSGAKSVKQYRGDENLPEAKKGMKNCGCKHPKTKYKYGTGTLTIPEGSAIVTANGGKNMQALEAYQEGDFPRLNRIINKMPEDNVDRAKNGIKNTYKKYKFKPGAKNVNAEDEDDAWIRKILTYEAKQGGFDKSTNKAYGLPNWGYNNWQKFGHSRSPRNIEEAIEYFKQDYLPKVKDYPLKVRKKLADYSYNSGRSIEDLLLLADDKINLDEINSNSTFTEKWNDNKAEILKKLNSPEFIKKLDAARIDVAKTTGTYPDPNDPSKNIRYSLSNPNPAYDATWKGRIENMQDEDETPVVNQNKQNSPVANPIAEQNGTAVPTAVQVNNQGATQQNTSSVPASTVNQNTGTTVANPNAVPASATTNPVAPKETWTGTGKTYKYKAKTAGRLDYQPDRFNEDVWSEQNYPAWMQTVAEGLKDPARADKIINYLKNYEGQDYEDVRKIASNPNLNREQLLQKIQKLSTDEKVGPFHVAVQEGLKQTEGEKPKDEPAKTNTEEGEKKIDIIPPPPPKTEPKPQIPGTTPIPPQKKNFMIPSLAEVAARGSILGRGIEQVPENYLKLGRYKYASQLPKTLQEIQLAEQAGREGARNVVGGDAGRYLSQSGNLSAARMKAANEAVIQDTLARQDILNKNVDLGNLEAETNTSLKNEYAQQRALARSAYDRQLIGLGQKIDNVTETAQEMAGLKDADEQRLQLLRDLGNNYEYKNVGGKYQLVPKTPVENTTPSETNTENQARKGLKRLKAYKRK